MLKAIGILSALGILVILIFISPIIRSELYGRKLITEQTAESQIVISCDSAKIEGNCLYIINPINLFKPNITNDQGKTTINVFNRVMASYLRTDIYAKVQFEVKLPVRAVILVDGAQHAVTSYKLFFR